METQVISISESSLKSLEEMSNFTGKDIQTLLDKAVEDYKRKFFLEGLALDFKRLRSDPKAWQEELEERDLWNSAFSDGANE